MTFGAHKLVCSEPFLDSQCKICQLLPAKYSEVRKKFIWVQLYIPCSKVLQWTSLKSLRFQMTKWCAQTFPSIFELFTIFDRKFLNIVAPSSNGNANYLVLLKGQWFPKTTVKAASKLTHKPWRSSCSNYVHLSRRAQRCGLGAWQTEKNIVTNTIFSNLQPVHIVPSSPNFAWW